MGGGGGIWVRSFMWYKFIGRKAISSEESMSNRTCYLWWWCMLFTLWNHVEFKDGHVPSIPFLCASPSPHPPLLFLSPRIFFYNGPGSNTWLVSCFDYFVLDVSCRRIICLKNKRPVLFVPTMSYLPIPNLVHLFTGWLHWWKCILPFSCMKGIASHQKMYTHNSMHLLEHFTLLILDLGVIIK